MLIFYSLLCFFKDLNNLAGLVRGELSKLARNVLCALITIDVHARDMVTEMVKNQVNNHESPPPPSLPTSR